MQNDRRRCSIIQGQCVVGGTDRCVPAPLLRHSGQMRYPKVPILARLIRWEESPISEEAAATACRPVSADMDRI